MINKIIILLAVLIFSLSAVALEPEIGSGLAFAESRPQEPTHDAPIGGNAVYLSTGEFYQETTDLTSYPRDKSGQ